VLAHSSDPATAKQAQSCSSVRQLRGAVTGGTFLRATANPVALTETKGAATGLPAQIQVYALALTLAFVTTLLGAAAITPSARTR
jgi:hypothetical protein